MNLSDRSQGLLEGSSFNSYYTKAKVSGLLWIDPLVLDMYLVMLNMKQESITYHFLSCWSNSIWDRTSVSGTIGEHFNCYANWQVKYILTFIAHTEH